MDILTYGLLNKRVEEAKSVSGEKITEAVNVYLDENPPTTGATAEQAAQIDKNVADIDELKGDLSMLEIPKETVKEQVGGVTFTDNARWGNSKGDLIDATNYRAVSMPVIPGKSYELVGANIGKNLTLAILVLNSDGNIIEKISDYPVDDSYITYYTAGINAASIKYTQSYQGVTTQYFAQYIISYRNIPIKTIIKNTVADNDAVGSGEIRSIYMGLYNTNDITFVGDELWTFYNVSNDNVTYIRRYHVTDSGLEYVGKVTTDFGHINVVDYCPGNDCLIFGNSANTQETEGNYLIIVKNPKSLTDDATMAECGIRVDIPSSFGYKVNPVWGESNLGQYNIVYCISNDGRTINTILLTRDDNGDFDGQFILLSTKTYDIGRAINGADYYGGKIHIGLGITGNLSMDSVAVNIKNDTLEFESYANYSDDGTAIAGSIQGIHLDSRYKWVFCNRAGSTDTYLVQYYR